MSEPRAGVSGSSSVARASAFQAEGRGFESRFPLQLFQQNGPEPSKRSDGAGCRVTGFQPT